MNSDDDLRDDLAVALHTVTETNETIRFADTKAGVLAGVQALMVTVLAAQGGGHGTAVRVLHAACLLGVLTSTALLAAGQAPRLSTPAGRANRLSFPALVRTEPGTLLQVPPLEHRHEEAWAQAQSLSRIAVTKFRWLSRAAASTAVTLAAVLTWIACVTWL